MARLYSCGFELQSATAGVEWDANNGVPVINTTIKRSGAASLRVNPSNGTRFMSHQIYSTADAAAHVFIRGYFYIASAPAAMTGLICWADSAVATTGWYAVKMLTDRTLTVINSSGTSTAAGLSSAVPLNEWHLIELEYDDTANVAKGYLDGTLFATLTSADLGGGLHARWGILNTTTSADFYIDDVAVNDTSGSAQTGLCGAGSIVYLRPNAAGDNNGFATAVGGTAGAGNNFTRVNETTPDDATSYNETTATGTTTADDFNCDSSAGAGINSADAVTLVQVGARVGSNAATAANLLYRVKSQASGTTSEGSSVSVAVNGFNTHDVTLPRTYKLTSYTDPQGSGVWTPALLDSMQIGYRTNVSQSTSRRVSGLWALVEYVPDTKPSPTPRPSFYRRNAHLLAR